MITPSTITTGDGVTEEKVMYVRKDIAMALYEALRSSAGFEERENAKREFWYAIGGEK
jgi:hypothetical protein